MAKATNAAMNDKGEAQEFGDAPFNYQLKGLRMMEK